MIELESSQPRIVEIEEPIILESKLLKQDFDLKLKNDGEANRFHVDGDYLVFDSSANLQYELCAKITLQDVLTKNPLVSLTRLNKNLLVKFINALVEYNGNLEVIASYRSPEYALLSFGDDKHTEYSRGKALAVMLPTAEDQAKFVNCLASNGVYDITTYANHSVYFSLSDGVTNDKTQSNDHKTKFLNFLISDKMKNYLLIGAAAVAGWFFFIRRKSA